MTAERTVLGHILRGQGHVHLTEVDAGRVTDPLLPGHLTPYTDTTVPHVTSIDFRRSDEASPEMPNFLRGTVQVIVEAYDTPTIPVPGIWNEMPITPALVQWRVETWNGKLAIPARTAWDTRITLPSNVEFWRFYARGTFQNMAVFGKHYSWLQRLLRVPGGVAGHQEASGQRVPPGRVGGRRPREPLVCIAAVLDPQRSGLGRGLSAGFYRFGLTPLRLSFVV